MKYNGLRDHVTQRPIGWLVVRTLSHFFVVVIFWRYTNAVIIIILCRKVLAASSMIRSPLWAFQCT